MNNPSGIKDILTASLEITSDNMKSLFSVYAITGISYIVLSLFFSYSGFPLVSAITKRIITSYMLLGLYRMLIDAYDGRGINISAFRVSAKTILNFFMIRMIILISFIVSMAPAFIVSRNMHTPDSKAINEYLDHYGILMPDIFPENVEYSPTALRVLTVAGFLLFTYIFARMVFSLVYLSDNPDANISECIKNGVSISGRNISKIIPLAMIIILINIIGIALFILPVVLTFILSLAIIVVAYRGFSVENYHASDNAMEEI